LLIWLQYWSISILFLRLCKNCSKNATVLLCGDWNFIQDKVPERFNFEHDIYKLGQERMFLKWWTTSFYLLIPWRICHPYERKCTWWQNTHVKAKQNWYFVLVAFDLFSLMRNTTIVPSYRTDRSDIVCTFSPFFPNRS
jgi:exonuclease III